MIAFIFFGMESEFGFHWLMLLLIVPLIFRLWWDYKTIVTESKEPNHTKHTIVTGVVMLALCVFVWRFGPAKYFFQPLFLSFCIFLMFFDYTLSLLRGLDWWYVDEGLDGKQSFTDKIYMHLPWWGILFGKLWFLLCWFSVYFYMNYIT